MSDLIKIDTKFYCFKCKKEVVSLYYHLKKDHNMTVDKYLKWMSTRKIQVKVYRGRK